MEGTRYVSALLQRRHRGPCVAGKVCLTVHTYTYCSTRHTAAHGAHTRTSLVPIRPRLQPSCCSSCELPDSEWPVGWLLVGFETRGTSTSYYRSRATQTTQRRAPSTAIGGLAPTHLNRSESECMLDACFVELVRPVRRDEGWMVAHMAFTVSPFLRYPGA